MYIKDKWNHMYTIEVNLILYVGMYACIILNAN